MRDLNLRTREGRQSFYISSEWRALRLYKIQTQPLCEECLKKEKLVPATEVHHIIDVADLPTMDNALDYNNLMSLCKSCHSIITKQKRRPMWKPFNMSNFLKKQGS
jgi:5-methylcytosine-specific restriction enzyme A